MDALVDVPGALAHLIEAGRLEAVLIDRSSDDRVEADVGHLLAVEKPRLAAIRAFDHARGERRRTCAGIRPMKASGGSTTWSSTEQITNSRLAPLGLGQEGDLVLVAAAADREIDVALKLVEVRHGGLLSKRHRVPEAERRLEGR